MGNGPVTRPPLLPVALSAFTPSLCGSEDLLPLLPVAHRTNVHRFRSAVLTPTQNSRMETHGRIMRIMRTRTPLYRKEVLMF